MKIVFIATAPPSKASGWPVSRPTSSFYLPFRPLPYITLASLLFLFVIWYFANNLTSYKHSACPGTNIQAVDTTNKAAMATDPLPLSGRNRDLLPLPIWGMFFGRRSVSLLTVSRYRPPPPQGYYNHPPPPQQYQPPAPQQGGYQQGGYQQNQQSQGNYRTSNGGYAPPTGAPVESNYHHTGAGYTPPNGTPHQNYAPYGAGAPSESSST